MGVSEIESGTLQSSSPTASSHHGRHICRSPKTVTYLIMCFSKTFAWGGLGGLLHQQTAYCTSTRTWVQISITYINATCGRGDLKPTDKRFPGVLWPNSLTNEQLLVQQDSLFQKVKSRAIEEDSWHWPLTSSCTSTHVYIYTPSCTYTYTNKFHHVSSFYSIIRNCNTITHREQTRRGPVETENTRAQLKSRISKLHISYCSGTDHSMYL